MNDSTLADVREETGTRLGRAGRRFGVTALAVFLLIGLLGGFGARTGSTSTTAGGYTVTVQYPVIARAGMDTLWRVTVRHPGGFDSDLTLATSADYFDIFESQGFEPSPSDETGDGREYYQIFTHPSGDTFQVTYDAYIQPASQIGRRASTALIVDGQRIAIVNYHTWLVP